MRRRLTSLVLTLAAISACQAATPALERQFEKTVRPFVATYCARCHSGPSPAAQFDLKSYTALGMVTHDFPRWALVGHRLEAHEMPPKALPQPPAEARERVIRWIHAVRAEEIRKNAGDPGLVLARRLSNAEYNYTIRDLTGQDLQPTREFPVDPANPAGFDNSAESLTMSSALLNKYLQAARGVADHMVLTPDGIDFAPYPMLRRNRSREICDRAHLDFYARQPTDLADYFKAAWRFKHRAELGKPHATLSAIAAEAKLSAQYLPMVWQLLEEKDAVGPIAKLQEMWRSLPATADQVRRDARFRHQDPEADGDAIRRTGGEGIAGRVAAVDELEIARVRGTSTRERPPGPARRYRNSSASAGHPRLSGRAS